MIPKIMAFLSLLIVSSLYITPATANNLDELYKNGKAAYDKGDCNQALTLLGEYDKKTKAKRNASNKSFFDKLDDCISFCLVEIQRPREYEIHYEMSDPGMDQPKDLEMIMK